MRLNSVLGAGNGFSRRGVFASFPILIFGEEILFRIKGLIPGDLLAGVSGDAAHDAHHGGIAHAGAVVDGVTVADAGVHLVMLYLVHVWLRAFVAPDAVVILDDALAAGDRGAALGAVDIIVVLAMAAGNLALAEESSGPVFEEVVDLDMIPDVAGIIRALTTANGYGATRRFVAKEPRDFVDAVHGLFHQTIAPAPSEIVPVAYLPFNVTPFLFTSGVGRHGFHGAGVVGGVHGLHIADGAVGNTFEKFTPRIVVAPAEPGHDGQTLFLGQLSTLHHRPQAGGVGGHGFFQEDVFVGFHGGLEMERTKSGWGGEDHDIHAAIEHLLIGVKSDKLPLVIDIDFTLTTFADISQRTVQPIAEYLAHRPELHVAVGRERLRRGTGAAAAATDKADFQFAAVRLAEGDGGKGNRARGHRSGAAGLDKLASVGSVVFHLVVEIVGMPLPFGNRRMWHWDKEYCRKISPVRWEVSVKRILSLA